MVPLYYNSVNLTEGTFNFTHMGSEHNYKYELNNFTDMGALNATGLEYDALPVNMTEDSGMEDDR